MIYKKIGKLKLKFPSQAKIIECIDVDKIPEIDEIIHCDYIILFAVKKRNFIILIEDTGVPEIRDLDKVDSCLNFIHHLINLDMHEIYAKIKIVHFRKKVSGIFTKVAISRRIEYKKCDNPIDIENILQERCLI